MVLVNGDQYPKIHLPSNLQPNLRFCDHPIANLRKYTLTLTILILPVMINALEKKMAASVGEKPTLSKPVMMMMVSTLAAPHLFDHYRRIVLSVGQIIALRKTESF